MSLADDLKKEVADIFRATWSERDGRVVPSETDIRLGNDCVKLDGVVLYADLDDSTGLVDRHSAHFAAEVYKAFLHCAAKVIRSEGGEITAFDGDRVMAVFVGDSKDNAAARTALKLNHVRTKIINPAIEAQYGSDKYSLKHVVGIDASDLHVARTGIRGSNDLVWVGSAANHAAKLCTLGPDYASNITDTVYNRLSESTKTSGDKAMWERFTWKTMDRTIYRSSWMWGVG